MNIRKYAIHSANRGVYLGLDEKMSPHFSKVKTLDEGLNFVTLAFANERAKWLCEFGGTKVEVVEIL